VILDIDVRLDYSLPKPAHVLLQIEAAAMADQCLLENDLRIGSPHPLGAVEGEETIGQRSWARAEGRFVVDYRAKVQIDRAHVDIAPLKVCAPGELPGLVIPYLLPSRYCESHEFENFVERTFGRIEGGAKVIAMRDWIADNIDYVRGVSTEETTAAHSFVKRQGVCRDFAHLLASFARAATIPARLVSAYAPDVEPPDFHALVEVWLEDSWHLVDATGMADPGEVVRIGVGRDATDIAFMTVFGMAEMQEQTVRVTRA
jgi:transglutaminase-like putative cysteine protease